MSQEIIDNFEDDDKILRRLEEENQTLRTWLIVLTSILGYLVIYLIETHDKF